jgi:hypothetical protein
MISYKDLDETNLSLDIYRCSFFGLMFRLSACPCSISVLRILSPCKVLQVFSEPQGTDEIVLKDEV